MTSNKLKPRKDYKDNDMRKPIIAVDFDGTIVEHKFPAIGLPNL